MSANLTSKESKDSLLMRLQPSMIDLPSSNWAWYNPTETLLIMMEMTLVNSILPRLTKHVNVNLETGLCTSYVLDQKISDVPVTNNLDLGRCVEELHMMHICVGCSPASNDPEMFGPNARIDMMGNWRHNDCKIVAHYAGIPCIACHSIQFTRRSSNGDKKIKIQASEDFENKHTFQMPDLSHRQQNQVLSLYKQRRLLEKQRIRAERKVINAENMIMEIFALHKRPLSDSDDDDT